MNVYKCIENWILEYTPLNDWIFFNATPIDLGTVTMNSIPTERVYKKFIDGSVLRQALFSIDIITQYDTNTSEINMNAMEEVDRFLEWIEMKISLKEYPLLDEYNTVTNIEILDNIPELMINESSGLAKYQFTSKITYLDEREGIHYG